MAGPHRPIIHGRDHAPGGADPIPGIGAGDGGPKQVLAVWGGTIPAANGVGQTWRVPTNSDGSSLTFTLYRAFARLESTVATDVVFRIEKSIGGGAFSPTTVTTLTVAAGDYDDEDTSLSGTIASGDLVRLVFVDVGDGADTLFTAELLGSE